jgi:hypothetical protein
MAPRGGTPTAHPDDGEQDARHRHDLENRVFGGGTVLPSDVVELRRLLAREGAPGRGAAQEGEVSPPAPAPRPIEQIASSWPPPAAGLGEHIGLHPRLWLAGGVVAVVVAGVVSAAVATGVTRAGVEAASDPVATTEVIGSPPVATSDGPVAEAQALGAQYFAQPQASVDRTSIWLHGIVPSSTHRVLDQFGPGSRRTDVWVAQGTDGSFCLIMAVGSTRAASSCTPESDVVAAGVQLDMIVPGGSIDVSWDLASGLLAFSPYASSVRVDDTQSGAGGATP